MTAELEIVCAVVGQQLGARHVEASSHLREDLGAESIDLLNIVSALEEKFGISFDDEEIEPIQTVLDFHRLVSSKLE